MKKKFTKKRLVATLAAFVLMAGTLITICGNGIAYNAEKPEIPMDFYDEWYRQKWATGTYNGAIDLTFQNWFGSHTLWNGMTQADMDAKVALFWNNFRDAATKDADWQAGYNDMMTTIFSHGYDLEYVDLMKSKGYIPDFQVGSSTKSASTSSADTATAATPEPVTTEKCDEKTMWATGTVNVRENGSTAYTKVGALKAGDAVTVTGIDSTGWYEIRLSDGTVGHVSNNYLTDVEPVATTEEVESTGATEATETEEVTAAEEAVPSAEPEEADVEEAATEEAIEDTEIAEETEAAETADAATEAKATEESSFLASNPIFLAAGMIVAIACIVVGILMAKGKIKF